MLYKEGCTIEINEDENVIKFKKTLDKPSCRHNRISVSVDKDRVYCEDCQSTLNPVWWISKHLEKMNSLILRSNTVLAEARAIYQKLENKNSFMCKYCHEVNTIDFKRLPSKKAINSNLKIVESELDEYKVEIK